MEINFDSPKDLTNMLQTMVLVVKAKEWSELTDAKLLKLIDEETNAQTLLIMRKVLWQNEWDRLEKKAKKYYFNSLDHCIYRIKPKHHPDGHQDGFAILLKGSGATFLDMSEFKKLKLWMDNQEVA